MTTTGRFVIFGLATGIAYVVFATLGLSLDAVNGFATLVWPPTGIALAALVLGGPRLWPAITIAAFAVNFASGAPLGAALGIAMGNTLEAVAGALLLTRLGFDPRLARVRDLALLVGGALASTALSAVIGSASLHVFGTTIATFWETLRAWWLGDALGDLVVAPVLFVATRIPRALLTRRRLVEAGLTLALVAAAALFVFTSPVAGLRMPYLVFPALIVVALRFGQPGATTATLVVWVVAIIATPDLLELQVFMGVVALTLLALGCAVSERANATAARDEFMAVASHELRTPLTVLDLQLAVLSEVGGATIQTQLETLKRQSERLAALTTDLLDVSQLVAGRFTVRRDPVDLRTVVSDVVARLASTAARSGTSIELSVTATPATVFDRPRLERIVANLVGNAIKVAGKRPIEISLDVHAPNAVLRVRDHGPGISKADQARVFERFERAGSAKPSSGLGLGLWIVRQIALAMGGTVKLESEPGRGSEFTVTLPLVASTPS